MVEGLRTSVPSPSALPSQNLHIFINLESHDFVVLQSFLFFFCTVLALPCGAQALHCTAWAFSNCGTHKRLVAEHGLERAQAQ